MIKLKAVTDDGYNFFTGVPDSGLKSLIKEIETSEFEHIPATNEGQAIGIAVGAELVGMKSCVYLQNSGIGNCINALTSLCIPHNVHPFLVIGHRHTLSQHKVMGEVDKQMLDLIGYSNYTILDGDNNVK
jgi:sulfopyruvate decarboxylase TPP-binding subunit